jgi:hypothetical protein
MSDIRLISTFTLGIAGVAASGGYGRGYGRGGGGLGGGTSSGSAVNFAYADQEYEGLPTHQAKLLSSITLEKHLPSPLGERALFDRTARVSLSNIPYGSDNNTISYIRNSSEVLGAVAQVGIYNARTSTYYQKITGVVSALTPPTIAQADLEISAEDKDAMQELLPKLLLTDKFPGADSTNNRVKDPPVMVALGGLWRAVELTPLHKGDFCLINFSLVGVESNKYAYADIVSTADFLVQTGDVLVYDVQWDANGAKIGVDLRCTDTTRLKDAAVNDQNGLSAALTTDLDSRAVGKWYRRQIALPGSWAGKTISGWLLGCENDTVGTFQGRVGNMMITDGQGRIRKYIIHTVTPTLTITLSASDTVYSSNSGNSVVTEKDNHWYYGAVKYPGSGGLTFRNVYRSGRLMGLSDYIAAYFLGCWVVLFQTAQVDNNGNTLRIHADVESTEFANNPSKAKQFLLNDATYGLGRPVNAASFATAAADYVTLGYAIDGGLGERRPAGEIISDLSLHGAYLDKNDNNEYIDQVDMAALHTTAPVQTGEGDGTFNNCVVLPGNTLTLANRVRKLTVRATQYRGFNSSADERYLITSSRSRAGAGKEEIVKLPFVGNLTVADKECDYLSKVLFALDDQVKIEVNDLLDAMQLNLNLLVKLNVPSMFIAAKTYCIRGVVAEGESFAYELGGYDANAYTYVVGTDIKPDPLLYVTADFSQTPPLTCTGLSVVSTQVLTSSAPGQAPQALFRVTAVPPAENITDMIFRLILPSIGLPVAEAVVPAAPGGGAQQGVLIGVVGVTYAIQVLARNVDNLADTRDGAVSQITNQTVLNTTPPAQAVLSQLITQPGSFEIRLTKNTEGDIFSYEMFRGLTDIFSQALKIGEAPEGNAPVYVDNQFVAADFNKRWYYFARAKNTSGKVGVESSPLSAVLALVDTPDITTGAVTSSAATSGRTINVIGASGAVILDVMIYTNLNTTFHQGFLRIRKDSLVGSILTSAQIVQLSSDNGETVNYALHTIDTSPNPASQTYVLEVTGTLKIDSQSFTANVQKV